VAALDPASEAAQLEPAPIHPLNSLHDN
jgi:hypothetical protein